MQSIQVGQVKPSYRGGEGVCRANGRSVKRRPETPTRGSITGSVLTEEIDEAPDEIGSFFQQIRINAFDVILIVPPRYQPAGVQPGKRHGCESAGQGGQGVGGECGVFSPMELQALAGRVAFDESQ